MKLVCGIPTKNEEWIIGKTLSVLTKFCDKIVILDDNSNDKTEEICKSFDNVEFIKRYSENVLDTGMSALGKTELFNHIIKYNPEYILMLDADEIPTPSFIDFFNNIDESVNCWSVRFINLFKNENHYRTDNFYTQTGTKIVNNPFLNNGWRKHILLKYNKNFNYSYNEEKIIGGISNHHPLPEIMPEPIKNTEDFYIIHYGKIALQYISGEKDKRWAKIEAAANHGTYEERIIHHFLCRTGSGPNGPEYEKCPKEWFWHTNESINVPLSQENIENNTTFKIDIIIPAHKKDINTLDLCIKYAKKNIKYANNVYVISKTKLTDLAIWYPENKLPFSFIDVINKIGDHWKTGWYYADILQGCAPCLIPNTEKYVLMLDADTIFLKPVTLLDKFGRTLFNTSLTDGTVVYNEYMRLMIPNLQKQIKESGITHFILVNKDIMYQMINHIQHKHGKKFWNAALDTVQKKYETLENNNIKDCAGKMANYELYFNYAYKYHRNLIGIKKLNSIMAYKGKIPVKKLFLKENYPSRTNYSTGHHDSIMVISDEELQNINFDNITDAFIYICERCKKAGFNTITFQHHTRNYQGKILSQTHNR